jgi:hypothetical protein
VREGEEIEWEEVITREGFGHGRHGHIPLFTKFWIFEQATYMCSQIVSEYKCDEPRGVLPWKVFRDHN